MAKRNAPEVLDNGLQAIKTGVTGFGPANKQVICSAEPTTYTEASATYMLGEVAITPASDLSIGAGGGGGNVPRRLTVAAKNGVTITNSGTATHLALVDTVNSKLIEVTTCTSQAVVAAQTWNIPSWTIDLGAAT